MTAIVYCKHCKEKTVHEIIEASLVVSDWKIYHKILCTKCLLQKTRDDHPLRVDVRNGVTYFLKRKRKSISS